MIKYLKSLFSTKPNTPEQHHRQLKQGWDSARLAANQKTLELVKVYTSAKGIPYFVYLDILDIPADRYIHVQKCLKALVMGLSDQFMAERLTALRTALASKNIAQATNIVADIEYRRANLPDDKMFTELAMLMLVRYDENPYIYNPLSEAQKRKDIEEDPDLRAFFLLYAWETSRLSFDQDRLAGWKIQSPTDFLTSVAGLNQ